ncbi:MAG: N-acetylmuramoyl-L-alanine amidase [Bdellovibrionia bacterium]
MRIVDTHRSPNFDPVEIPVEYLILHYTACDLQRALEIFGDPAKKVCAHFVLDTDGAVYDLGGFYNGPIRLGAHAGLSRFEFGGRVLEKFNTYSIGIEIVNLNGNLFSYTDEQYESLGLLTRHLQTRFPNLQNPQRVLGHEHIAGFRGKVDPGIRFDWKRFYKDAYGLAKGPARKPELTPNEIIALQTEAAQATDADRADPMFWSRISASLEEQVKKRNLG